MTWCMSTNRFHSREATLVLASIIWVISAHTWSSLAPASTTPSIRSIASIISCGSALLKARRKESSSFFMFFLNDADSPTLSCFNNSATLTCMTATSALADSSSESFSASSYLSSNLSGMYFEYFPPFQLPLAGPIITFPPWNLHFPAWIASFLHRFPDR